ncbi:MAG: pyridoxal-phosphate dependent enzyme [Polyangia bacterium]
MSATRAEALLAALRRPDGPFPRVELGRWPTPVEPVDIRTGDHTARVWIKRDDLSSSVYGGNKVRKLEYLLFGPRRAVITAGARGSHHLLATALHARALGRPSIGIVLADRPRTTHADAVHELVLRFCDRVVPLEHSPSAMLETAAGLAGAARLSLASRGATAIPPGASTPLGTLGYVAGGLEIALQAARGGCPPPAVVYTALGTGGTAAGLALGLALAGLRTRVVAVRVATRLVGNRLYLRALADRTLALLRRAGLVRNRPRPRIEVDHRFVGAGYGHPTPASRRAIRAAAESCSADFETTYTGKALAALLADSAGAPASQPRMFLDTYGPIEDLDRGSHEALGGEPR